MYIYVYMFYLYIFVLDLLDLFRCSIINPGGKIRKNFYKSNHLGWGGGGGRGETHRHEKSCVCTQRPTLCVYVLVIMWAGVPSGETVCTSGRS